MRRFISIKLSNKKALSICELMLEAGAPRLRVWDSELELGFWGVRLVQGGHAVGLLENPLFTDLIKVFAFYDEMDTEITAKQVVEDVDL